MDTGLPQVGAEMPGMQTPLTNTLWNINKFLAYFQLNLVICLIITSLLTKI